MGGNYKLQKNRTAKVMPLIFCKDCCQIARFGLSQMHPVSTPPFSLHFTTLHFHNSLKNKRQTVFYYNLALCFADWTGLEPATPCVTGMYSNQLNYRTVSIQKFPERGAKIVQNHSLQKKNPVFYLLVDYQVYRIWVESN